MGTNLGYKVGTLDDQAIRRITRAVGIARQAFAHTDPQEYVAYTKILNTLCAAQELVAYREENK